MYDQVNLSSPGSTAPVDHWHNDSIAFAGVVVLSDMEVVVRLVIFNKKNSRYCQQCNVEVVMVLVLVWTIMLLFGILGVIVVLSLESCCEIHRKQNLTFKYFKCSGYARGEA